MSENNKRPWHRQPKEPGCWYALFTAYLGLGHTRTQPKAMEVIAKGGGSVPHPSKVKMAAIKWRWSARADAYDAHYATKRMEASENAMEEIARDITESARQLAAQSRALLEAKTPEELQACKLNIAKVRMGQELLYEARHFHKAIFGQKVQVQKGSGWVEELDFEQ